jgi:putative FmdB family regulatory protein
MPTYEYRCPNGHHFELFQRMSDEPTARCPQCGVLSERLLSGGAGFLFKGNGFYITDYRSDSYKKEASKEAPSDASPPAKGGEKEKAAPKASPPKEKA